MECVDYVDLFNKMGLPIGLLVGLLFMLWKAASWIAPRIDNYVTNYLEIAQKKAVTLEQASSECAKIQSENLNTLRELTELIRSLKKDSQNESA